VDVLEGRDWRSASRAADQLCVSIRNDGILHLGAIAALE
jgi:hypothetical protein